MILVRRSHFETLAPVCPVCAIRERRSTLEIATVLREEPGHVVEGIVRCTEPACLSEFPIVDGILYLLSGLRELVARDIDQILARDDVSSDLESLLGDCCGPGSRFDSKRQQLSTYGWDHWADLDPAEETSATGARPGATVRLLAAGLERAGELPPGPVLDLGCAVGRAAFELAAAARGPVLGIDLNTAMLRLAVGALRRGRVRYPRRRVGMVYESREFGVSLASSGQVDFWACDAEALPFPAGSFAAVVGLNFLDSVRSPVAALASLMRVLVPGGKAILACPYDWSPAATLLESWIGGHSQRGAHRGASEQMLRLLLTPGAHPASLDRVRIIAEEEALPWHARLHDRSTVDYRTHLVVVEKLPVIASDG